MSEYHFLLWVFVGGYAFGFLMGVLTVKLWR